MVRWTSLTSSQGTHTYCILAKFHKGKTFHLFHIGLIFGPVQMLIVHNDIKHATDIGLEERRPDEAQGMGIVKL